MKSQSEILEKLGIGALNEMQEATQKALQTSKELVLLSPTGSGKTLAFLLPLIQKINPELREIQALIVVPTRELAQQINQVIRSMGAGIKSEAVFGGRSGHKDRIALDHTPAILVGTPGRLMDHIENEVVQTSEIKYLVLDEFDKSLEIGFKDQMEEVISALAGLEIKILTSATQKVKVPEFVGLNNPKHLNFLTEASTTLSFALVECGKNAKFSTLKKLLLSLRGKRGIVFCNLKDSIAQAHDLLFDADVKHELFFGGLEQLDRERALIKFRNGTSNVLLATDLAARGIDVPELDFIVHYELPQREDEFIHRNGRTARMNANGTAFILKNTDEDLPDFIPAIHPYEIGKNDFYDKEWVTLHITGGRRDKISKGDIAGLFLKQGKLDKNDLGIIELQRESSYVAVALEQVNKTIELVNNQRLKKKKVRITILD